MLENINVPNPLKQVLRDYCHVEWSEEIMTLRQEITTQNCHFDLDAFKQQLSTAIKNQSISPSDFEAITDDDLETHKDVADALKLIWNDLFG